MCYFFSNYDGPIKKSLCYLTSYFHFSEIRQQNNCAMQFKEDSLLISLFLKFILPSTGSDVFIFFGRGKFIEKGDSLGLQHAVGLSGQTEDKISVSLYPTSLP